MTIGYLADSFDLFNVRELDLIAQARSQCARLVVGVFSDQHVEQVLGRPPVIPLAERVAIVSHVRGVDEVVVHEGSGTSRSSDEVHFQPADRLAQGGEPARSTIVLAPNRTTASRILGSALAPVGSETAAVA